MTDTNTKSIQIEWELADDISEAIGNRKFKSVQGANIIPEEQNFEFGKRNSKGEHCEIIFEIEDSLYLSHFIDRMPYGIINKKATGIGATTLEIECPRNSIIVMPTKSLAYTKFLKYHNTTKETLYVGSEIGIITTTVTKEDIQIYVNDNDIVFKKILVVADSLPKVIDAIGDSVRQNFFIMIDEVDVLQSDSGFRPALENVMDYYFKFPRTSRCVVSATIREFSHPELKNESVVTIVKKNPPRRNIILFYSENNNINGLLKEQLEKISTENPDQKILIAYNSVKGIMDVISNLSDEMKRECGVLCSKTSKEYAKNCFRELDSVHLTDRITFMTSAFFVGIDIEDRFHLITVCNSKATPNHLSINKITQIHGRCRNYLGLYSDTILYSDLYLELDDVNSINLSLVDYEKYLFEKSDIAIEICNYIEEYKNKNFRYLDDTSLVNLLYTLKSKLAEASVVNSIPTLRVLKNRETKYAYFNIDNLLEQKEILELDLYTNTDNFKNALIDLNHLVDYTPIETAITSEQIGSEIISGAQQTEIKIAMAERAIGKIRDIINLGTLNDSTLGQLIRSNTPDKTEKKLCERFKELYRVVPAEPLFEILKSICDNTERVYKSRYNMLKFWSLEEDHPFKHEIKRHFTIGRRCTKTEILEILQPLMTLYFSITIPNEAKAIGYLSLFFEIYSTSITIGANQSVDGYAILDLLPVDISAVSEYEPLNRIYRNVTLLRNEFKF
jgi:hypothetical protein